MSLQLKELEPFARGGNRLCFVHPYDDDKVVKVRRPDFTLEDRRKKKGFPKNLRPLSSFDDNLEEFNVLSQFQKDFGEYGFKHISHLYGFEETDMGKGLSLELIRDFDGTISKTLKYVIWFEGVSASLQKAVDDFSQYWGKAGVPSRDLLLHNVVVQKSSQEQVARLVVIDGLGSTSPLPNWLLSRKIFIKKAAKKVLNFHERIKDLLERRDPNLPLPGYHGELFHDGKVGE